MVTVFIDNKPYEVEGGQNLLHVCLSLKLDLPYFCWHPALHSVGACRQCAVKQFRDEQDKRGKIVMACMTPVAAGMRISIDDPEAREFRAGVIEFLMVNHPHDCPVCDEGGECHLQDMTVMTGHDYRHYRFQKRTHRNQYLGPLVNHEMNRCIACYRCVRYYRDYADGRDLDVFGAHDNVYFGRAADGVLESEFSGNLVEVCPTGVFTDKTLQNHYTRKWDLQTAPSVCVHCAVGCNTIPGERYGTLRRIHNRYNHEVNGYFLCDRGRYGYEFVNSNRRIGRPLVEGKTVGSAEALARIEGLAGGLKVLGIGSPRASLESNFALRQWVGPDRFYQGLNALECQLNALVLEIVQSGRAPLASLSEAGLSDVVFVLGEDVTNTAPMLALALRQAARRQPTEAAKKLKIPEWHQAAIREVIQDKKGPFYIASVAATRLDDVATKTCHGAPEDLARLGFAVAHFLDAEAPGVADLSQEDSDLARAIATALSEAQQPLVVSGVGCKNPALLQAAANVAWALRKKNQHAKLSLVVPECNSLGLALLGGKDLESAFQAVRDGEVETVIILENDLFRQAPETDVEAFLDQVPHVVVLDHLATGTSEKADVVLPVGTFAESSGTLVNNEGRAQRFYEIFFPAGEIQPAWRWLGELSGHGWKSLDQVATAQAFPAFREVPNLAPPAGFRVAGEKIPRQPSRYSGRTALRANINVHEPCPPSDPDSPLAYSMEGFEGIPPSSLIPRFWQPRWNSVQALNKYQEEIGGVLKGGDPGRRLIEPSAAGRAYYGTIPMAFARRLGEWLAVPLYHIFGSEELSVLSPGIAQLAARPYLALNPQDAAAARLGEGQNAVVKYNGSARGVPVKTMPSLPPGLVGLPVGLPETAFFKLPAWVRISKEAGV